jgi:hypothetical protein
MGWQIQGGRRYYYRVRRLGRRVVREFCGPGPEGELAAALDRQKRVQREARQAERRAWEAACGPLAELAAVANLLTNAVLLSAGYHRHHQGEWRRKRVRPA